MAGLPCRAASNSAAGIVPARALPHVVPSPGGGHRRRCGSRVPRPALLSNERAHLPRGVGRAPHISTPSALSPFRRPACWALQHMHGAAGDAQHGDELLPALALLSARRCSACRTAEWRGGPARVQRGWTLAVGRKGEASRAGWVCNGEPRAGGGPLHQPGRARVARQDRARLAPHAGGLLLACMPANGAVTGAEVPHAGVLMRAGAGLAKRRRIAPSDGVWAAVRTQVQLGMPAGGGRREGGGRPGGCRAYCRAGVTSGLTGPGRPDRLWIQCPSCAKDTAVDSCLCTNTRCAGPRGGGGSSVRAARARLQSWLCGVRTAAVSGPWAQRGGPPMRTWQRQGAAHRRAGQRGCWGSSGAGSLVPGGWARSPLRSGNGAAQRQRGALPRRGGTIGAAAAVRPFWRPLSQAGARTSGERALKALSPAYCTATRLLAQVLSASGLRACLRLARLYRQQGTPPLSKAVWCLLPRCARRPTEFELIKSACSNCVPCHGTPFNIWGTFGGLECAYKLQQFRSAITACCGQSLGCEHRCMKDVQSRLYTGDQHGTCQQRAANFAAKALRAQAQAPRLDRCTGCLAGACHSGRCSASVPGLCGRGRGEAVSSPSQLTPEGH